MLHLVHLLQARFPRNAHRIPTALVAISALALLAGLLLRTGAA